MASPINSILPPTSGALQKYFVQNTSWLRSSTSIVIASSPPPSAVSPKSNRTTTSTSSTTTTATATAATVTFGKVDHELRSFHSNLEKQVDSCFFMGRKNQMRMIPFGYHHQSVSSSSSGRSFAAAYPTASDVQAAWDLMQRVGCTNIIAVGSGAAIDLAKCVHAMFRSFHPSQVDILTPTLILVPQTVGGIVASVSRETLVYCTEENSLLPLSKISPFDSLLLSSHSISKRTVVLIDPDTICIPSWSVRDADIPSHHSIPSTHSSSKTISNERKSVATIYDAAFACLGIAIDAAMDLQQQQEEEEEEEEPLQQLQEQHEQEQQQLLLVRRANIESVIHHSLQSLHLMEKEQEPMTHRTIPLSLSNTQTQAKSSSFASTAAKLEMIQALLHAGPLLNWKCDNDTYTQTQLHPQDMHRSWIPNTRSFAFTFSSSLLPQYFPHGNWLSFHASLFPGILALYQRHCDFPIPTLQQYLDSHPHYEQHIVRLDSLAEGSTPDINTLLDKMDAHGALIGGQDRNAEQLEHVLIQSLHRS